MPRAVEGTRRPPPRGPSLRNTAEAGGHSRTFRPPLCEILAVGLDHLVAWGAWSAPLACTHTLPCCTARILPPPLKNFIRYRSMPNLAWKYCKKRASKQPAPAITTASHISCDHNTHPQLRALRALAAPPCCALAFSKLSPKFSQHNTSSAVIPGSRRPIVKVSSCLAKARDFYLPWSYTPSCMSLSLSAECSLQYGRTCTPFC